MRKDTLTIDEIAQEIISEAIIIHSNDIHILPESEEYIVYLRTSQYLKAVRHLKNEEGQRLIAYFKYLGDMDVGEHRRPQSGSCKMILENQERDLRFSTMTNFHAQESLVIRILNPMETIDLRSHSFFPQVIDELERLVKYQSGLILFSGPVGSGKTTTMYQLIRNENQEQTKNVICIEDPVEIEEVNFLQIQVNHQAGITYESLLKQSLRHHPDIIIIGEIRDEETAQAVIRAALTGHLILATVHAKNAEGVLPRLMELGVSKELITQVLIGVVFQKMLPRYCKKCNENTQLKCKHIAADSKQAVLFDVRQGESLEKMDPFLHRNVFNFNSWLRKALKNEYIDQATFDHFAIPKTNFYRYTD